MAICIFRIILHNFKTSHVIVYQQRCIIPRRECGYFKTSHVIVYQFQLGKNAFSPKISKHLMLLFILSCLLLAFRYTHFKTSHVIVYLDLILFQTLVKVFQNISCYCLSISWD